MISFKTRITFNYVKYFFLVLRHLHLCVLLLFFLNSCKQSNSVKNKTILNTDTLFNAIGIVMDADSIKPPVIINAKPGIIIKAGISKKIPVEPNFGEAGGTSYMQNYNTDNGLALDAICEGQKSAICDKAGNLWFGTQGGGVSRYDGKSFKSFKIEQGLTSNIVKCILEDKSGNLWFGTENGLSCYNGKRFINYTQALGFKKNFIYCITEDKYGNIWFGGGGLSCYEKRLANNDCNKNRCKHNLQIKQQLNAHNKQIAGCFTNFTTEMEVVSMPIYCITKDRSGNIWFGNAQGLTRYEGALTTNEGSKNISKHNLSIHQNIIKYNKQHTKCFTKFATAQGLVDDLVYNITEDKAGNLWFATSGGLSRFNDRLINNPCSKHNLSIQTEFKKHNSELAKCFTNYTTKQGLVNNVIKSMVIDKIGNLWLATEGGISRYDGNRFTNFTTEQGLVTNFVNSVIEDKNGNMWFGTFGGGLCRYDGKSFTNYTSTQGLASNFLNCINEDKQGNIWFATNGSGLTCYNGKSFSNFAWP